MDRRRVAALLASLSTLYAELAAALLEEDTGPVSRKKSRQKRASARRTPTYHPRAADEATDLDVQAALKELGKRGMAVR